jgi:hypothetical protein
VTLTQRKIIMSAIIINTNQFPIQTVSPTLAIGEVQLSADRRSTTDKKLTDAERVRRVVLPVNHWGELAATVEGTRSQALTDVLRAALVRIGSERLKDALEESPMLPAVNGSDYTVAALLTWSEETATSRGSITFTRQQAEEWFLQEVFSRIGSNYEESKRKAICDYLRNRFGALAAKNHGLSEAKDATKMLSLIPEEAAALPISIEIAGRLTHIEKALTAKANEATVSMDDL